MAIVNDTTPVQGAAPMPPCDRRAEHELCALMAISPSLCADGVRLAREADFMDPFWRRCFAGLRDRGFAAEEFVPRVYECSVGAFTPEHVGTLAARIRDLAERRRIINAAAQIAERAWNESRPFTAEEAVRLLGERRLPAEAPRDSLREAVLTV